MIALRTETHRTMRRFFLFAVLWAALFGSGHVLALCPMEQGGSQSGSHGGAPAAQAPCHSASTGHDTKGTARGGHDCCAWLAPSASVAKAVVQKSDLIPAGDGAAAGAHFVNAISWDGPQASRPPPIPIHLDSAIAARRGTDTFLRTARLRL
jgi:hypothetical protein